MVPVCPTCAGTVRKARRIPIPPPESQRVPIPPQESQRVPIQPPESQRTPKLDHNRQWSTSAFAPPAQTRQSPTPSRDQRRLSPTLVATPEERPVHSLIQTVSQPPFYPDDPIVLDPPPVRAQPVNQGHPGSPGRPQSIFSLTGSEGHRRRLFGLFRPKEPKLDPLPENLAFTFSATGESILLWKLNGHSLSRIQVKDRNIRSLPLRNALQAFEGDRTVTIKLIHEGKEWIAIILDNKQVRLCNSMTSSNFK
jgi:hypothetical protein